MALLLGVFYFASCSRGFVTRGRLHDDRDQQVVSSPVKDTEKTHSPSDRRQSLSFFKADRKRLLDRFKLDEHDLNLQTEIMKTATKNVTSDEEAREKLLAEKKIENNATRSNKTNETTERKKGDARSHRRRRRSGDTEIERVMVELEDAFDRVTVKKLNFAKARARFGEKDNLRKKRAMFLRNATVAQAAAVRKSTPTFFRFLLRNRKRAAFLTKITFFAVFFGVIVAVIVRRFVVPQEADQGRLFGKKISRAKFKE